MTFLYILFFLWKDTHDVQEIELDGDTENRREMRVENTIEMSENRAVKGKNLWNGETEDQKIFKGGHHELLRQKTKGYFENKQ